MAKPFQPPVERERRQWRDHRTCDVAGQRNASSHPGRGAASSFSKKFRHACVRARAASKRVSVIAVSGNDVIIVTIGRDGTGHDRFLADVGDKTADLLR